MYLFRQGESAKQRIFNAKAAAPGRSRGRFGNGLRAEFRDRFDAGIDYTFDVAPSYRAHGLTAAIGIRF